MKMCAFCGETLTRDDLVLDTRGGAIVPEWRCRNDTACIRRVLSGRKHPLRT